MWSAGRRIWYGLRVAGMEGEVMGRVLVRCVLAACVLAVVASAVARVPAQFEVVERFAAALSAGNLSQVRTLLLTEAVLTERDLVLRSAAGTEVHARLRELYLQSARLEVTFESAAAGGAVIVTRERLWLDDMPETLVPLRSTVAYVVDDGRLLSINRMLDADQRHILLQEAIVGAWHAPNVVFNIHADGTYDIEYRRRPYDSGAYTIERDVMRLVSGEQTAACRPGDVGLWRVSFATPDRHMLERIEELCSDRRTRHALWLTRITE